MVGELTYGTGLYTIIRESTCDETPPIVNTNAQTTSRHEPVNTSSRVRRTQNLTLTLEGKPGCNLPVGFIVFEPNKTIKRDNSRFTSI